MKSRLCFAVNLILVVLFLFSLNLNAQNNVNREMSKDYQTTRIRKTFFIPDIPGYVTLKGDFHTHTCFSDGSVWPDFRVTEAWAEGLDIIAITDHIENRPNRNVLPEDLNLGYKLAVSKADQLNILFIPGAEITKKMPNPGHFNALFVQDVNKLTDEDPMKQIEEAINQGAFILWNHPGSSWIRPIIDTTKLWDFHKKLLDKEWIHGIEVFNTDEWFPIALEWCIKKNLTVFSNTDIHTPINYWYDLSNRYSHRAMTLVFAKSRSLEAVKDALFDKKTIGFFGNTLVGSEDLITELFNASIIFNKLSRQRTRGSRTISFIKLENPTDLPFILKKKGDWKNNDRSDIIELLPRSSFIVNYSDEFKHPEFELLNCYYGINKHPIIKMPLIK